MIEDGVFGPKTKMLMAGRHYNLPDKLSPEEISALVDLTIEGKFGNRSKQKTYLGKWYRVVRMLVNRTM